MSKNMRLSRFVPTAALWFMYCAPAHAQFGGGWDLAGTISEYTTSGATVNDPLIGGLGDPLSIAVAGSSVFVVNGYSETISEYTTSGATVNAALPFTGVVAPGGIAISGSNLFVANAVANGTIGEYTTSGATVNASLITGLYAPIEVAVSGSNLFVLTDNANGTGTIGEYTTSGSTVNAALITAGGTFAVSDSSIFVIDSGHVAEYTRSGALVTSQFAPLVNATFQSQGLASDGSNLFVLTGGGGPGTRSGVTLPETGTIAEYDASGAAVNGALITGLVLPGTIAVSGSNLFVASVVPEPSAIVLAAFGGLALLACRWRRSVQSGP